MQSGAEATTPDHDHAASATIRPEPWGVEGLLFLAALIAMTFIPAYTGLNMLRAVLYYDRLSRVTENVSEIYSFLAVYVAMNNLLIPAFCFAGYLVVSGSGRGRTALAAACLAWLLLVTIMPLLHPDSNALPAVRHNLFTGGLVPLVILLYLVRSKRCANTYGLSFSNLPKRRKPMSRTAGILWLSWCAIVTAAGTYHMIFVLGSLEKMQYSLF